MQTFLLVVVMVFCHGRSLLRRSLCCSHLLLLLVYRCLRHFQLIVYCHVTRVMAGLILRPEPTFPPHFCSLRHMDVYIYSPLKLRFDITPLIQPIYRNCIYSIARVA